MLWHPINVYNVYVFTYQLNLKDVSFYLTCICVFCLDGSVGTMCMQCPRKPGEGVKSHETGFQVAVSSHACAGNSAQVL